MCLPLIYICGAVIWCSSAHHPFVQIHNNKGVDLGKGIAEGAIHTFRKFCTLIRWPFSLPCSHQKASTHSAALLDLIVVRIDSTTVNGLNNKLCQLFIKNTFVICVLKGKM